MKIKTSFKIVIISCFLCSCSISNIIHKKLDKINVYDDEIKYEINLINENKEIILIPIKHIGTETFYMNLKNLISEYQNNEYFVFYEKIYSDNEKDTTTLRKFRKILPFKINTINSEINYIELIENLAKSIDPTFTFKKEVIHQPTYEYLIEDMKKSKRVDFSKKQFIDEYEKKFGEILLDSCDYVDNWETSQCKPMNKTKNFNKIAINTRNDFVIDEIMASPLTKILVVYGENHIEGIKLGLKKNGYKEKK
jgi:hypothetical protein